MLFDDIRVVHHRILQPAGQPHSGYSYVVNVEDEVAPPVKFL